MWFCALVTQHSTPGTQRKAENASPSRVVSFILPMSGQSIGGNRSILHCQEAKQRIPVSAKQCTSPKTGHSVVDVCRQASLLTTMQEQQ